MLMKIPARSGEYALCVRYTCAGIGADTERWLLFVKDQTLRVKRHQAILRALRDSLVSPDGALVATMLPHLTGLKGALMVRTNVGRAPPLFGTRERLCPAIGRDDRRDVQDLPV